ncbi:MAG: hypothetical protein FJ242_07585 [Nitrospira sp.]|nr:hypothetical protein [Nitrospira sp.]
MEIICDHLVANLSIETDDFGYAPFAQEGGIEKVHQISTKKLRRLMELSGLPLKKMETLLAQWIC